LKTGVLSIMYCIFVEHIRFSGWEWP